jgi:hypothetical protein
MPAPEQILSGLSEIVNTWRALAVFWHVYFGAFALALALQWRPSKRVAGVLLGLPLLSASALAWTGGNPFNGTLLALSGIALIVIAIRQPDERVRVGAAWTTIAGGLLFTFGWVYPHFLETASFWPYLYSAPTGLIPCPTLSVVIGLGLILGGLGSRPWSMVLGATGIFYGLFGALRLGVSIDWVLVLGASIFLFSVIAEMRRQGVTATTLTTST